MKVFVTSFSSEGYRNYGEKFLTSFVQYWPKNISLLVYHEADKPPIVDSRITYVDLNQDADRAAFVERHKNDPVKQGIVVDEDGTPALNYRFQSVRFSHKVFALTSDDKPTCDWLIWIDSDVVTTKPIPENFFDFLDDSNLVYYLGRMSWPTSECGFVAYNMSNPKGREFLVAMRALYTTDALFQHKEWHDSYLFDRIREEYEREGEKTYNLSKGIIGVDVWPETILGEYLLHLKGPLAKGVPVKKTTPEEHNDLTKRLLHCVNRYAQLDVLIAEVKPWHLVEVGTWNGDRAMQMITEALKHRDEVTYTGFDLFEQASPQTDAVEFNVKRHQSMKEVQAKLKAFGQGKKVTITLVPGNTRQTIPNHAFGPIDFAFIDGGHSIETIQSDHDAIEKAGAKVIVHDDWYLNDSVDTTKFGCNAVLKDKKHMLLPVADKFDNGVHVGMVICGNGIRIEPKGTPQAGRVEGNIQTKNCVEPEVIQTNVRRALELSDRYREMRFKELREEVATLTAQPTVRFLPQFCQPHKQHAFVVGGDDTIHTKDFWNDVRDKAKGRLGPLFVTKTSHDVALKNNVVPFACFLLDPRPHVADAFTPDKRIRYLVSSMCDKSVYDKLFAANCKVYGYHAGVNAGEDKIIKEFGGGAVVFGGTTAGLRGLNVLYILGFRHFELFGFNCSYQTKPSKAHGATPKPLYNVESFGKQFITDAELLAQTQDIEVFSKMLSDAILIIHGNGMGSWIKQHIDAACKEMGNYATVAETLKPFLGSFNAKEEFSEAYWLENVITQLTARQALLKHHLEELPVFGKVIP